MTPDKTKPAPVILVSGPAAAGKTSTVDHFARQRAECSLHVSLDDVRDFVKAGYANPEDGWTDLAERQYRLARASCASIARLYAADGYQCLIDDAVFPDWPEVSLNRWCTELKGLRVGFVVILADFEVLVERNKARLGNRKLNTDMLRIIYDRMRGWHDHGVPVIDNTALTVRQTADELHQLILSGQVFGSVPLR
ncbi:MAG: AAA family ATPase [Pseudonocardiaceae bacterium]